MRPGEELNQDKLESYLRGQLSGFREADRLAIEQFPGGHSNLTYLLNFGSEQFVLRRPPLGPVAPTAHNMPREFRVLEAVHPHFALAPGPLLLCEDTSIIGAPFYLMERRSGLIVRNQVPKEIGEDLLLRTRVSLAVVDTLIALHEINIRATGIESIGKPAGFVARQVKGWSDRWQRSKTSEVAEMDHLVGWLENSIPPDTGEPTLVHNDFKLDNIMLAVDDPGRVVAVLDWEMCSVGEPLIDLGLLLCYWTLKSVDERLDSLRPVKAMPGWLNREQIIERYITRTKRDLSRIVFYETFARFKVAVIIQQIYFRFLRGQTSDERFRHFDRLVRLLARSALAALPERVC